MALQGKNGGVLAFPATGLEQAVEELKQICSGVPKEIQRLVTKISHIIAVLKDAEKTQISSEVPRFWLGELKQVAFDAEDLIDELATDAAVQSMGAHTDNIPTISTPSMMGQIHEMNDRLDALESQIDKPVFQLSSMQDSCPGLPTWRQTGSLLPDETSVVGRDREKEQIIEMLTQFDESSSSNNKGFSIVPIVGLGGVGKTTLAQLVYNDERVKNHFELMMWVCVSNDFDPLRLTKDIIEAALAFKGMYKQCQVNNWDSVQRRLLQEVEGKAFLLVLDDVWEAEQSVWKKLLIPLHFGKKGSKVLVTARNRAFVNKLEGPMEAPIPLGGLSDDDIWVVFKKCAFRGYINADGTISAEYSHLEDLGRRIVQRLKGSPLAARTIGSLLNIELSEQHWKTVLESELWKLEHGEGDILPALQLSYQYLPPDLKQCFAYCSIFPKDHMFSREEVVRLWEAQSFIRNETVGSKHFDDLLHMSFFEPKTNFFGEDYYVMHDLVHDLAECVSSDDCFRVEDQKTVERPDTVRHVSVYVSESGQIVDIINKLCFCEKLRTLLFRRRHLHLNTHEDLDQLFLKLKMLRVLELSYCGIRELPVSIGDLKHLRYIDLHGNRLLTRLPESLGNLYNLLVLHLQFCGIRELPDSIGDLKQLRYIDLKGNDELKRLPESLGNLYNLQVLNLNRCGIRELPVSIGDLKHLKYIYLYENDDLTGLPESLGNLYNLQVLDLIGCESLRVLPSTMSQLVNLRHLQTDNEHGLASRIDGLGKLTGLQKLRVMGRKVRELGGMCMLRELEVYNLEEVGSKKEAIQARLQGMERLQVLHLNWSREENSDSESEDSIKLDLELDEEVLQALRPNKGIRDLHIGGYMGTRSPDWMEASTPTSFSSLRRVSLFKCPNWQVPPCSFLSQLRHLEYLQIYKIPEWEGWSCPVSWECLLGLNIQYCPKLRQLPLLPPTLRRIVLNGVGISCLPELDGCSRVEGGIETASSPHSPPTVSASLSELHISSCDNLTSISGLLQQHLPNLEEIEIRDCRNLVTLPEKGFGHLVSLKRLKITNCPKLTCLLPMQKEEDASTQHLPCSLEELEIKQCGDAMGGWWWTGLQRFTSTKISLFGCPTTAEHLFLSLGRHHHLHLPGALRELLIVGCGCNNYEQQSTTFSTCPSQLTLPSSPPPTPRNVDASARALRASVSLKEFTIRHSPNFLQKLGGCGLPSSLERLTIVGDDNLDHNYLSACLYSLISLNHLTLKHLENLRLLPNLSGLTSLESLGISHCPSIETLDLEEMSLPSSLKSLTLVYLKNLRSLPHTLNSCLSSLKTLTIRDCPSLQSWPASGLPSSLETLQILECPALTGRHEDQPKSMWPEVAHIPKVIVDWCTLE